MTKSLTGKKVAMLVANGFDQSDMTAVQKALIEKGANVRIVSSETGLVNGWSGNSWGHNFAVDETLSTVLGADYDMVVVPGGERSANKLKLTAHSKRFLGSFVNAAKPIVVMGDALALLVFTDMVSGRTVDGGAHLADMVVKAGGVWSGRGDVCRDGSMLTGAVTDENRTVFVEAIMTHFDGDRDAGTLVTSRAA